MSKPMGDALKRIAALAKLENRLGNLPARAAALGGSTAEETAANSPIMPELAAVTDERRR